MKIVVKKSKELIELFEKENISFEEDVVSLTSYDEKALDVISSLNKYVPYIVKY